MKHYRCGWDSFIKFVRFEVEDDTKNFFWHDKWNGDLTLKEKFLEFLIVAKNRDARVAYSMDCSNGAIHWNPLFFRPVQDWEMKAMEYFLDDLYSTKVRQEGTDKIVCHSSRKMDSRFKAIIRCCIQRVNGFPWEKHLESLSFITGSILHLDYCSWEIF